MGLALTILYIVLTILSPTQFGPAWANYHALVYLAVVTALFSLPNVLSRSSVLSSVQTYLLLAFILAIGVSQIANHWLGGALQAWLTFLPSAAVFFFIVANVTTLRRLQIVTIASVVACLALVGEALGGYYAGFFGETFVVKMTFDSGPAVDRILRLRAVGFLADPNDFAQILIIALALLFIAWRQGRAVSNFLFVLAPAAVLLWAVYLTHSRGALIGLAVLALMAGYKRLGKVPALVLTGIFGLGMIALDFTGGRAIDPSAGADRLELWAEGLELFKHSPIFGVGFGNFLNFSDHTAHNSFILPLAELGIIGATIFVALLVTTTLDLNHFIALRESPEPAAETPAAAPVARAPADAPLALSFAAAYESPIRAAAASTLDRVDELARLEDEPRIGNLRDDPAEAPEAMPIVPEWSPDLDPTPGSVSEPAQRVDLDPESGTGAVAEPVAAPPSAILPGNPLAVMRLALVSFMATGWFLSRTYETTIYLVLGLAVTAAGLEPASTQPRDHRRWISVTLAVEAFLVIFVYFVVRLRH